MSSDVLFSVLMPTFNSESYIDSALASLNSQGNHVAFEVIFADGGSTDSTLEKIAAVSKFPYQVIEGPDKNMYDGLNKCISRASGRYILFLNSDDSLSEPEVLVNVSKFIKSSGQRDCYCSDIRKFNFSGRKSQVYRYLSCSAKTLLLSRHGTFFPHPGVIIAREFLKELGPFDIGIGAASDYDFCLRILEKTDVARLPYVTHNFFRRESSLSHDDKFSESRAAVLVRHGYEDSLSGLHRAIGFYLVWLRYKIFNLAHAMVNYRRNRGGAYPEL